MPSALPAPRRKGRTLNTWRPTTESVFLWTFKLTGPSMWSFDSVLFSHKMYFSLTSLNWLNRQTAAELVNISATRTWKLNSQLQDPHSTHIRYLAFPISLYYLIKTHRHLKVIKLCYVNLVRSWRWRNDRRNERNLCNCVKKPEKNSGRQRGFEPVTSRLPVRSSTNWAMKPLTLGAGQL